MSPAAIAVAHPKWQERPLLVVVAKPGSTLTRDTMLDQEEVHEMVVVAIERDWHVIEKHIDRIRGLVEEVLQLGKGAPGGKSPLVDFHNVRMNGGTLRIALPWNPDRALVTQAQKDSALQAERAKPGRVIEESPEGLRRIILLSDQRCVERTSRDASRANASSMRPSLSKRASRRLPCASLMATTRPAPSRCNAESCRWLL